MRDMSQPDPRMRFLSITPIDPREKGVKTCPSGCIPPMIMHAIPNLKSTLNAKARCLVCGTFWEVTPQGLIVNQSQWLTMMPSPGLPTPDKEPNAG